MFIKFLALRTLKGVLELSSVSSGCSFNLRLCHFFCQQSKNQTKNGARDKTKKRCLFVIIKEERNLSAGGP